MSGSYLYREASIKLDDQFRGNLSSSAYCVARFLLDRTYRWASRTHPKKSEYIPIDHFLNGVKDSQGKQCTAPCGLSRSALFTALKELTTKGLISVQKGKHGRPSLYTLNIDLPWEDCSNRAEDTTGLDNDTDIGKAFGSAEDCGLDSLGDESRDSIRPSTKRICESDKWTCPSDKQTCESKKKTPTRVLPRVRDKIQNTKIRKTSSGTGTVSADAKTNLVEKLNSKIGDIQKTTQAVQNAKLAAGKVSALIDHWHRKLEEYFPEAHFATFTIGDQAEHPSV